MRNHPVRRSTEFILAMSHLPPQAWDAAAKIARWLIIGAIILLT